MFISAPSASFPVSWHCPPAHRLPLPPDFSLLNSLMAFFVFLCFSLFSLSLFMSLFLPLSISLEDVGVKAWNGVVWINSEWNNEAARLSVKTEQHHQINQQPGERGGMSRKWKEESVRKLWKCVIRSSEMSSDKCRDKSRNSSSVSGFGEGEKLR